MPQAGLEPANKVRIMLINTMFYYFRDKIHDKLFVWASASLAAGFGLSLSFEPGGSFPYTKEVYTYL